MDPELHPSPPTIEPPREVVDNQGDVLGHFGLTKKGLRIGAPLLPQPRGQ